MHISTIMKISDRELFSSQAGLVTSSDPQNNAFAGVGKPINESLCRLYMLNFAKRNAEKAAMRKAM